LKNYVTQFENLRHIYVLEFIEEKLKNSNNIKEQLKILILLNAFLLQGKKSSVIVKEFLLKSNILLDLLDSNKNILKKPVQSICDIIGLKNDHNDTQINNNDPKSKSQQIEIDFSAFDKEMNEDNALIDTFEMLNISLPTTSNSKLQEKPQNGENAKQDKKSKCTRLICWNDF